MQIKDWGEERWVQHLKELFPVKGHMTGIGDDCAVIPYEENRAWLVTTDALVEGVHFLKEQISALDLGYKTIAVNVSDIAAMGGSPAYAFLSIAFPKNTECQWAFELIQGMKDACKNWNIQLLGGDTVGSKRDVFMSLTLVGSTVLTHLKYRHTAKSNDVICVTGYLGNSGAGLQALQENIPKTKEIDYLIHSHFHPEPHLQEGIWLASHNGVHAMMDLSDGLDCDLKRLIKSSGTGAAIETSKIPLSPKLLQASLDYQWNALKFALTGGEDYCLLLTVSSKAFPEIQSSFHKKFGSVLHEIGKITDQTGQLKYQQNGILIQLDYINFDHFQMEDFPI
ncbi:MAG: thiamine-phosphate kinase [Chlamydiales bacterium]